MKNISQKIKKLFCCGVFMLLVLSALPISVSAVENPYPTNQIIGGVSTVPCTYYAWQQVYDNMGVNMPNFGNAKNWYTSAQSKGYAVGSTPKAKSVAVWTNSGYGHVAYVVSVNGSKMTVNEGGMYNTDGSACNGNGIIKGSVCNSTVGSKKSSYSSSVLVGFIYPAETSTSSVELVNLPSKNTISENNAILWGQVNKPSSFSVTKIGIRIRKDGSSYSNGWSKYEAPSKNYVGSTYMNPWYNMNTELGLTLTHATKYYYQIYAVVNSKEYWSSEASFTTKGSHSYGSWSTTKSATCTASGTKTRKCSGCSATETQTISALGHNYSSSYTVDKVATCAVAGSKSRHCTRCGAKTDVTAIPALTTHSLNGFETVKEATCTDEGVFQTQCTVCDKIITGKDAPLGHNFSSSWTVDKKATCTAEGSKSHHCSRCGAKSGITSIAALSHSWSDWKTTKNATTERTGLQERSCERNGCSEKETKVIAKLAADGHTHKYQEWKTVTAADCDSNGKQERGCTVCGEKETREISKTGHSFGAWKTVLEATETSNGQQDRTCDNCGVTESREIPELISDVDDQITRDEIISENEYIDADAEENIEIEDDADKGTKWNIIVPILIVVILALLGLVVFLIVRKK